MNKYPLSFDIAGLPVIVAEPWLQIGPGQVFPTMEGAAFDRAGNLLVCHRTRPWSDVVRIDKNKNYTTIYHNSDSALVGVAVHKDGRIFAVDIDGMGGRLFELDENGAEKRELFSVIGKGFKPNDLQFDARGDLYVSNFQGDRNDPSGAIYRLHAATDYTTMEPICTNLASPNGVAFSPDGSLLWTGETTRNCVTRIMLDSEGKLSKHFLHAHPTFQCTGFEVVDSNKVDAQGNVYQAMMYGGRVLILNSAGIPIANVLLSDRDEGTCMYSPNLALDPYENAGYIVTSGTKGAWIYKFESLAPSAPLFSHA